MVANHSTVELRCSILHEEALRRALYTRMEMTTAAAMATPADDREAEDARGVTSSHYSIITQ